jgi:hypothetical protein
VEVYHVREAEGVPYLAMPLLEGETLAARLKRDKALPPAEVVRLGREMADGLAAAHAAGLIHRDVKPSNVWLEAGTGRVKLLDFGLVREEGSAGGLTGEGAILGTPAYMAPEQIDGPDVDGRADLFSLGCVLYHLLTGRAPFPGKTLREVLRATAATEPAPPRSVNAAVPGPLSDLVVSLLAKDRDKRPGSARGVAEALCRMEAEMPQPEAAATTDEPPPTATRPPRPARERVLAARSWRRLALAAALVLLLGAGALAAWLAWGGRASPGGEGGESAGPPPTPPTVADPLRVLKIDVRHFARIGEDNAEAKGLIGERSFAAALGDQVTIEARLSRPAYAYLIAFRPDGVAELCFPEDEDEPPPLTDRPRYPVQDRKVRYGLSDGAGLMAFAVLASDRPLPPYRQWSAQNRPVWRAAEGTVGEVWWDDGHLLDTLTRAGPSAGDRAKGEQALGRSAALVRLTDSLKKGRPADAVGCLGFVVGKR